MTTLAPPIRQGLTAMQAEFVRLFIETGERERATIEAAYSGEPSVVAWRLLRTPAVVRRSDSRPFCGSRRSRLWPFQCSKAS